MRHSIFGRFFLCMILLALGAVGCQNAAGPAVDAPSVDPIAAAEAAIAQYDKDGDGALSKTEIAACPGLLPALAGKQQLTKDEIATQLEAMYNAGVGMMTYLCTITLDGQPLVGASVRLVPEKFLGDAVHAAEGTTSDTGLANLAVPDDQLPEDQRGLNAMQPGVYKVEVTHPNRKIPANYNTKTTLGAEVNPVGRSENVVFSLKSK